MALLHKELAIIGASIPDAERRAKTFGSGTRDAVLRFQKEHGLPTNGIVDGDTAKAINKVVSATTDTPAVPPPAVPADQPPATPTYVVDGTVRSPDRAGVGGLLVRLVDKNVGQDVSLAQATTDARGALSGQLYAADSSPGQDAARPRGARARRPWQLPGRVGDALLCPDAGNADVLLRPAQSPVAIPQRARRR